MSDPLADLYQSIIVRASRDERRRGTLANATHRATVDNPMCGDVVTLQLVLAGTAIDDIRYDSRGCALSVAAAALLADRTVHAELSAIRTLDQAFRELLAGEPGAPIPDGLGDLAAFAGVRAFRSRKACALLPFAALHEALNSAFPKPGG
jgi:nitrogen fixation protein NifU and related proteins